MGNDDETIKSKKGNVVILFGRRLKSKNGFVPGIQMRPILADIGATLRVFFDVVSDQIADGNNVNLPLFFKFALLFLLLVLGSSFSKK